MLCDTFSPWGYKCLCLGVGGSQRGRALTAASRTVLALEWWSGSRGVPWSPQSSYSALSKITALTLTLWKEDPSLGSLENFCSRFRASRAMRLANLYKQKLLSWLHILYFLKFSPNSEWGRMFQSGM